MKKQRWRLTKGKQYKCSHCGCSIDKRYLTKEDKKQSYVYCSSSCNMYDVGMTWSDFA